MQFLPFILMSLLMFDVTKEISFDNLLLNLFVANKMKL